MNTWDKCKNCGGERGIHHYETDQCPVGGCEAHIGRKQEYKTTVFEIDESEKDETIAALRARVAELKEALRIIADRKNWRTLNGEIVWNDFDGNDYHTEHAMDIAAEALK